MPAKETVIQFVFIATWLQITPSRRRPGPISQPACRFHQEPRCRKNVPSPALAERWVPAFAGKAREGHIRSPQYSDDAQLDYSRERSPAFAGATGKRRWGTFVSFVPVASRDA